MYLSKRKDSNVYYLWYTDSRGIKRKVSICCKYRSDAVKFLREFIRIIGNIPLDKIGVREVEHFLSVKASERSEFTVKRVYSHLSAIFETARRWEYITENPFKKEHL